MQMTEIQLSLLKCKLCFSLWHLLSTPNQRTLPEGTEAGDSRSTQDLETPWQKRQLDPDQESGRAQKVGTARAFGSSTWMGQCGALGWEVLTEGDLS